MVHQTFWVSGTFARPSYMRDRITEKLLQQQTGHKTLVMLNHYSGHKIAGDRERIRQAQIETFGGLLPNNTGSVIQAGTSA